jgi:DNA polymerase-3 subunit delta
MYHKELELKLQKGLPGSLLLYGENDYLIDFYIDRYIRQLGAKEDKLTLYFDEWDFAKAKSYLSQSSLFGGINLLIVRYDKKIPAKELDTLIGLTKKNSDNYFVFAFRGSENEAKEAKLMHASFDDKKGGNWVRFFEPNSREGVEILNQKAQSMGLDIDHFALGHLLLALNNNLSLCANALEKLAISDTKITGKEIDRLIYSAAPLATEQLLVDLFENRPITETIGILLELGEDEESILRATQKFVNEIFLFNAYIKLHGTPDSQEILGYKLPKQIEEKKAGLATKIKSSVLLAIMEHLLKSELYIKRKGSADKESLLYGAFIKMQTLIQQQR